MDASDGAGDDVAPWVAGSQMGWDLVHGSQGTAARRLRVPYLVRQQHDSDDGVNGSEGDGDGETRTDDGDNGEWDGEGGGEAQGDDPFMELRGWLDSLVDAPPVMASTAVDGDGAPAYGGVDEYFVVGFGAVPASGEAIAGLRETSAGEARERVCAVCLHDFEAGDALRGMPCSHSFHERCIFDWLRVSGVCPLCRHRLPPEEGP